MAYHLTVARQISVRPFVLLLMSRARVECVIGGLLQEIIESTHGRPFMKDVSVACDLEGREEAEDTDSIRRVQF